MDAAERARLSGQVRRFYKQTHYQLIWVDGNRSSDGLRALAVTIQGAETHGLPGRLYPVGVGNAAKIPADRVARVDVQATAAFFRFFSHLLGGRLDPRALESRWTLKPERPDLVGVLASAVENDDLEGAFSRLQPSQPGYVELRKALVRYRAIASKGGWPAVPVVRTLKPGDHSPAVPQLRQRLAIEGDLDASHEKDQSPMYDAALADAVRRFEERHRLTPDGAVDPETVRAMNVPVEDRIRAIELNLERWRWLPDKMPARYLMVNVPDYRLDAIENQHSVLDMRVVVGAPANKTPIFADQMTHVIFSPYWNIPPNIARNETIPKAADNPDYLDRNNMEVVDASGEVIDADSVDWSNPSGVRIRQRPGTGNALGGVKFMFPNKFDVYLHDTNAGALFSRLERGLSHGCVRIEEPEKLAAYVLRDVPEWTPEAIQAAMRSGRETHVRLKTHIPVFIVYMTAWVHDGGVRFLKDIYGDDVRQAARLWPEGS
jgi:murein L,D-transpeptidase YcbB/YkuD